MMSGGSPQFWSFMWHSPVIKNKTIGKLRLCCAMHWLFYCYNHYMVLSEIPRRLLTQCHFLFNINTQWSSIQDLNHHPKYSNFWSRRKSNNKQASGASAILQICSSNVSLPNSLHCSWIPSFMQKCSQAKCSSSQDRQHKHPSGGAVCHPGLLIGLFDLSMNHCACRLHKR
jgi:hypothetical protein